MLASLGESATLRNSVVEIVTHPSYYLAAAGNDLALLRLASAVDYAAYPHIRPACLPADNSKDYACRSATTTGWGRMTRGNRALALQVSRNSDIQQITLIIDNLETKNMIFAGSFCGSVVK